MNHYFSGFNTKEITLNADESVKGGTAVCLADDSTVTVPASGEKFCGICTKVRASLASVVLEGHTTVGYSGTAPSVGYCNLAADGSGKVKLSDGGREILVVGVDETEGTIDIIM